MSIYTDYYGHTHGVRAQTQLCAFFAVELPWAFGARKPGMRRHLPTPWWDRLKIRKSNKRSRRRLRRFSKRPVR